ncbi:glycosyltransferase [Gramella sp. GC03-9]|uniref:Glycosyltransferase n=1 Tax=Christiangramia oceanisediminis TaxID=2920386 RepID=A0A9X2KW85_9FLAO|nr:glycosyltransferase [Gramella oceanisediminis]MCP9199575.1 glycosyltransferase [Gramella oceanisediminis]
MKIGVLVTNYNTWALTSQCIENTLKFADEAIDQVLIIDDCSTEKFENKFDQVELIRNSENIGLIKSLNKGLKEIKTDLILILDSDAWPLENYVKKIKEYFSNNPEIGIATFETLNAKGKPSPSYVAEPSVLSLLLGQQLYSLYLKKILKNPREINVFTCAMVIRREVLNEIGVFDEKYDWLELDHDICMRASRKGWKIGVMPIRAFHQGSGTPQRIGQRVVRFYKNRWYLLRKFRKVKQEHLTIFFICLRLGLEYIIVWTIGSLYYRDIDTIREKAYSRRVMIKYFLLGEWKMGKLN